MQRYTCKAYKIPGGRSKATIIEFLNGLLFIGGKTQTERSSQVDFFDTTNDSWHSMPPMINKRKQPGAAVYKGLLYVIGGKNPTAEQYDPQTKAWSLVIDYYFISYFYFLLLYTSMKDQFFFCLFRLFLLYILLLCPIADSNTR